MDSLTIRSMRSWLMDLGLSEGDWEEDRKDLVASFVLKKIETFLQKAWCLLGFLTNVQF